MCSVSVAGYSRAMDSTCPACGRLVSGAEGVCPGCHSVLDAPTSGVGAARLADVAPDRMGVDASRDSGVSGGEGSAVTSARQDMHISPDGGIQTFVQPDGATLGPHIAGREILQVASIRGAWAQVVIDGEAVGWVDGRRLLPPVAGLISSEVAEGHNAASTSIGSPAIGVEALVSALAAIGVLIGALLDWTQGIAVNSFKLPVAFLFDPQTASRDPRLGYLLMGIGLLGLAFSFVPNATVFRFLLGALALGVASLYCAQIAHQISLAGGGESFTDVVGAGPWVTGVSGAVLLLSPFLAFRT